MYCNLYLAVIKAIKFLVDFLSMLLLLLSTISDIKKYLETGNSFLIRYDMWNLVIE